MACRPEGKASKHGYPFCYPYKGGICRLPSVTLRDRNSKICFQDTKFKTSTQTEKRVYIRLDADPCGLTLTIPRITGCQRGYC